MTTTSATNLLSSLNFGGKSWTPNFIQTIDQSLCIGCGRCFKSCGRAVLMLRSLDKNGNLISSDEDKDNDEDEDEEYERKVMTIASQDNCIGCESCSRACPKGCVSHAPLAV